ncbi:MAG: stimulus-sensing domain-containing protein [Alphaproteobacteria bacterium]
MALRLPRLARPRAHDSVPRHRLISPLTRRILYINIAALLVLVAGLLYLGRYQDNLIEAELQSMRTQAEIFAGALGQGAHGTLSDGTTVLRRGAASPMLRRLVQPTRLRARLFTPEGLLLADSRALFAPGSATVRVISLPPPDEGGQITRLVFDIYEWIVSLLPGRRVLEPYVERLDLHARDFPEAVKALAGGTDSAVRIDDTGALLLSVAVPVQRFKQVLGGLLLTGQGNAIDEAVREVRFDILKVFGLALAVTVLLSLYLAGSIVRPLRLLAAAANRVRLAPGREQTIPDFAGRDDEIGALATDLQAMTAALWLRLNAIESFAADVAHEIKNPLTSLRSAVETAARIDDPAQQRQLMDIILDDVQRLDRLISDISDASRLDTELAREEHEPIALDRLLAALGEVHRATGSDGKPEVAVTVEQPGPYRVAGIESRLVQVFQNLLSNAFSFSPAGGKVAIDLRRNGDAIIATIDDDGPGIPESGLDRVFDRFYSERPEGERFGTHSGLGLSISRQIIEAHGGRISAENRVAADGGIKGARFIVHLPAAP